MKRLFLLLSLPRSGTTMFCEMLDSHPMISCPHEPFADHEKRKNWREYLESLPGPVVVGHAHFNQLYSSMLTEDIPRILLEREDFADGALAQLLMTGHRPDGQYLISKRYITALEDERKLRTTLMRPYAHLTLSFEAMSRGRELTVLDESDTRIVCDFLGVPTAPLTTTMKRRRHNPANLKELRG